LQRESKLKITIHPRLENVTTSIEIAEAEDYLHILFNLVSCNDFITKSFSDCI
jgi:hypothetical protein